MRTTLITVGIALATTSCMRDTVEQASPTEPAMEREATMSTPSGGEATPSHGLLDAPENNPEEFGAVHWGRDLDAALAASKSSGKPVFLLFTEVPGCSTVKGFANGPLRHPLIVEAIEDEFEPVVVRNNVGGEERQILNSFNEPTWNNPVVRFLDADRKNLTDRYARGWTSEVLAKSMVAALEAADRPTPPYLQNLVAELSATPQKTVFSMYCFWTGEVKLAGLDGVISTRPGFANGREVVEVVWDAQATTEAKLLRQAKAANAASGVLVSSASKKAAAAKHFDHVAVMQGQMRFSAKDDKYQIRKRRWGWVPMTPAQATAVNRAVTLSGERLEDILSPRQMAFANTDQRFDGAQTTALKAPNH